MINQDVPGLNRTVHATNNWLSEISDEVGIPDAQLAHHALRGVLFATRDRLTVDEAMDLSAQLPALIRGIFFEGYKPSNKPLTYRDREVFLERVSEELQTVNGANPEDVTRAVFTVLNRHISPGEVEDVRRMLPKAIRQLWPVPEDETTGAVE